MNIAKTILSLEHQWQEIDQRNLNDNIRSALYMRGYIKFTEHLEILMQITESSKHSAQSWLNYSRENVKIPFLKVCKIAAWLDMDIEKLLKTYQCDLEKQDEKFMYIYQEMTKQ